MGGGKLFNIMEDTKKYIFFVVTTDCEIYLSWIKDSGFQTTGFKIQVHSQRVNQLKGRKRKEIYFVFGTLGSL